MLIFCLWLFSDPESSLLFMQNPVVIQLICQFESHSLTSDFLLRLNSLQQQQHSPPPPTSNYVSRTDLHDDGPPKNPLPRSITSKSILSNNPHPRLVFPPKIKDILKVPLNKMEFQERRELPGMNPTTYISKNLFSKNFGKKSWLLLFGPIYSDLFLLSFG